MNETTSNPQPTETKPERVRKARAPRSVTRDPAVVAIYAEAREKVKDHRNAARSAGILKTMLEKRVLQLTVDDRRKLFDALQAMETPRLPAV